MAVALRDDNGSELERMTVLDLILALNGSPGDFYVVMDVDDGSTYPVRVTVVDVQRRTIFLGR